MMTLIVDSREPREIRPLLRTLKIDYVVRKLDVGDYETDHCIFERKTVNDFLQSIRGDSVRLGGRLFDQLRELSDYAETVDKIPFLCIVGLFSNLIRQVESYGFEVNLNAICGAIASSVVRYGVTVLQFESNVLMLRSITKIEEKISEGKLGVPHRPSFRRVHKDRRIAHIANVLRVSPKVAERLFEKFGGLYNILTANDRELLSVDGIGPITLARIKMLLGKDQ